MTELNKELFTRVPDNIELPLYVPESTARKAIVDPAKYAAELVNLGGFTIKGARLDSEQPKSSRFSSISAYAEDTQGVCYPAAMLVQFPGVFKSMLNSVSKYAGLVD